MSSYKFRYAKVAVYGSQGVGKTAFIVRLITKRFIGEYEKGKEIVYSWRFAYEDEFVEVDILDGQMNQGCEKTDANIKWADAFILVYSITDKDSLASLCDFKNELSRIRLRNAPVMIIGNKRDLEHFRQVLPAEGTEFSEQYHCLFYELSVAEDYDDVIMAFTCLINEIKSEHVRCGVAYDRKSKLVTMKNALKHKLSKPRLAELQIKETPEEEVASVTRTSS